MAGQLVKTARSCGIKSIIDVAGQLAQEARANVPNWIELVRVTCELLELCRSTQSIYLREAKNTSASVVPTATPVVIKEKRRRTDLLNALNKPDSDVDLNFQKAFTLPPFPEPDQETPATERIVLRQALKDE